MCVLSQAAGNPLLFAAIARTPLTDGETLAAGVVVDSADVASWGAVGAAALSGDSEELVRAVFGLYGGAETCARAPRVRGCRRCALCLCVE
jgi:hypothetical protein